jgi:hypothetical protein
LEEQPGLDQSAQRIPHLALAPLRGDGHERLVGELPIAAPTCATSLAAGPSRSSRAMSEACSVAGTARTAAGVPERTSFAPHSCTLASTTALVSSSTKSDTPSVRSTISSTAPGGKAPSLPAICFASAALSRWSSRLSVRVVTWARPVQGARTRDGR